MTKDLFFSLLLLIICFSPIKAQNTKVIKTPEERFKDLPNYNFASNYIEIDNDLEMHYIDEGDIRDPVILLVHGEPSWSFIYRNMIPLLVKNGYRVIAPDLIGFGKSDKFVGFESYTYTNHTKWLTRFIETLELKGNRSSICCPLVCIQLFPCSSSSNKPIWS